MDLALKIAAVLEFGVLALLFVLSIWSIAIMIDRRRALAREAGDRVALEELRALIARQGGADQVEKWIDAHPGLHAGVVQTALAKQASGTESIDRAVRSYMTSERLKLEKGLPVLATLGANAPFIGLFGTVLGIIRAFAALGESSGAASSVMSGISQALIATAAGLFVAIPAVVAFNSFSSRLREMVAQCESLRDLWVAETSRRNG